MSNFPDGGRNAVSAACRVGRRSHRGNTSPEVARIAAGLRHFVVENAKTARHELKRLGLTQPLCTLDIRVLPEGPSPDALRALLAPLFAGESVGLMSEAGCPAVADPGAALVGVAHQMGIRIVPLVGPSSVLLGLMASGLNGQNFAFHGYLPVREPQRSRRIVELERESLREGRTQIIIETPYRNTQMLAALLAACQSTTRLCIASALTCADEFVRTLRVGEWRSAAMPELHRRPTVFLFLA